MQTIFLLEKRRNTGLFPLVMQAFQTGPVNEDVILYRDLHWRFMPSGQIAVEFYDKPVMRLPQPLALASFELQIYDFRDDKKLKIGRYKFRSAEANVLAQTPGRQPIYEIEIVGTYLSDANALYYQIIEGHLDPLPLPK